MAALSLPAGWRYLVAADVDDDGAAALAYLRALRGAPFPLGSYTDAELLAGLDVAAREFERATGRVFVAREGTLALRAEGGRVLFVPEPIVSVDEVRVDGSALDLDDLDVHAGTELDVDGVDPRDDPWIAWIDGTSGAAYLAGVGGQGRGAWPDPTSGPIVEIDGTFGFVESDGSTPALVRGAILALLQRGLVPLNDVEGRGDFMRGAVIQEMTRGRGYMLSQQRLSSGVFLDREIDRVIATYRRPARVLIGRSRRTGRDRRAPLYR